MVWAVTGSTAAARPPAHRSLDETAGRDRSRDGREAVEFLLKHGAVLKWSGRQSSHEQAPSPLPHDDDTRWPGQLAAIDMGSNSFRLEIAQLDQGRYRRVDYLKETVRLGGGLDANGLLTGKPRHAAWPAWRASRSACRLRAAQVRAWHRRPARGAQPRRLPGARADRAGHPIEVISGREARLIYAGVSRLQPSDAPRLVVDIGGRSTEMILGHGRQAQTPSFQVGSVSLSMRFFGEAGWRRGLPAPQVAAGAELEEALEPFAPVHWRSVGALGHGGRGVAAAGRQRHHRRPHHAGRAALADRALHRVRPHRPARLPGLKETAAP